MDITQSVEGLDRIKGQNKEESSPSCLVDSAGTSPSPPALSAPSSQALGLDRITPLALLGLQLAAGRSWDVFFKCVLYVRKYIYIMCKYTYMLYTFISVFYKYT